QPPGAASIGAEYVLTDRRFGKPADFDARPGRAGNAPTEFSRGLERRTGPRAGRPHYHTTNLRAQQSGNSSRRPGAATDQQPATILARVFLSAEDSQSQGICS